MRPFEALVLLWGRRIGPDGAEKCPGDGGRGRRGLASHEDCAQRFTSVSVAEYRKAQILERLKRYSSSCGCELASIFMLVAVVLFLIHIARGPAEYSLGEAAWRGFVRVLSATVLGKFLGLTYARVRLHMLRSALRKESPSLGDA